MEKFRKIFGTDEYEDILQLLDAKLRTDDGAVFDVHKLVLARKSPYFCKLFCCINGKDRREFDIHGITEDTLSLILLYLYTGRIPLTYQNITNVMVGADYLSCDDLFEEVEKSLYSLMHIDNCVPLIILARQVNNANIFNDVFRFIQIHFDSVVNNHRIHFAELELDILSNLLRNKSLHTFDERSVWLTIVEWVQKDSQNRLSCVPLLLKHLARQEVDIKLAEEIMSHSIVKNNPYYQIAGDFESQTSLHVHLDFAGINSDPFLEYRIPPKLYVVEKRTDEDRGKSSVYLTYDESMDMCRKIADIDFFAYHIILLNNNLYLFFNKHIKCLTLNLKENKLEEIVFSQNCHFRDVVKLKRYIYIICVQSHTRERHVHVLDSENNSLRNGDPYIDIGSLKAASVYEKIYILGIGSGNNSLLSIVQVYDPENQIWSELRPPEVFRSDFSFVAYHDKLFVIGGGHTIENNISVEIFDPNSQTWKRIANQEKILISPKWNYGITKAIVWNDTLIVFKELGYEQKQNNLHWNEIQECWKEGDSLFPFMDLWMYQFREIDDPEMIRNISKGNQFQNLDLIKTDFK